MNGYATPGPPNIMVLGGSGFVGRHTVRALAARSARITVGSRNPARVGREQPALAARVRLRRVNLEYSLHARDWAESLRNIDVVINCVGILRPSGHASYERVHHHALAALAEACRRRSIRLIHVSALGLNNQASSAFLTSKRDGERALKLSGADWWLVRPSLLDGDGGYGAYWIRRVANWPLHVVPNSARGRIAPLAVVDLGLALARLAVSAAAPGAAAAGGREFELGGHALVTLSDYLRSMRTTNAAFEAPVWRVPGAVCRLLSHVCDLLAATPYSFGHYELLMHDNVPRRNRLRELLGRQPTPVGRLYSNYGTARESGGKLALNKQQPGGTP